MANLFDSLNSLDSLDSFNNISPIDGRYYDKVELTRKYFTEASLIKSRIEVEIEYVIFLGEVLQFPKHLQEFLGRGRNFHITVDEIKRVKRIEADIHHDVKAVEIFLREKYKEILPKTIDIGILEWIHFGLTSQDVNHLAFIKIYKKYITQLVQECETWTKTLTEIGEKWDVFDMLAHTHGQPATPTTLGHEMMVFVERWEIIIERLKSIVWRVKFGGATGGLHAHKHVFPDIDWNGVMDTFIKSQGFVRQQWTTQIDHYDHLCESFDCLARLATVGIDFCRDIWSYISLDYLELQKISKNQVGSSTMPHKINPIHFEQAEGNLMLAVNLFQFFSRKLPISRLQRDLTDSTVSRNIGVAMGHLELSLKSIKRGFKQLQPRQSSIEYDLEKHPEIWGEIVQTYLRACGYTQPYQLLRTKLQGVTDKNEIRRVLRAIINEFDESKINRPQGLVEREKLLEILPKNLS